MLFPSPWNRYPYTDAHEISLDWVLKTVKWCEAKVKEFMARVIVLEEWRRDVVDPFITAITNWKDNTVDPFITNITNWKNNTVDPFITTMTGWKDNTVDPFITNITDWKDNTVDPFMTDIGGRMTVAETNITNLGNDKQDKLIAGSNIQIAADGKTISATDTTYGPATTSALGLVKPDNSTIVVDADGVISATGGGGGGSTVLRLTATFDSGSSWIGPISGKYVAVKSFAYPTGYTQATTAILGVVYKPQGATALQNPPFDIGNDGSITRLAMAAAGASNINVTIADTSNTNTTEVEVYITTVV